MEAPAPAPVRIVLSIAMVLAEMAGICRKVAWAVALGERLAPRWAEHAARRKPFCRVGGNLRAANGECVGFLVWGGVLALGVV